MVTFMLESSLQGDAMVVWCRGKEPNTGCSPGKKARKLPVSINEILRGIHC